MKQLYTTSLLATAFLVLTQSSFGQTPEEKARAVMQKYVPCTVIVSVSGNLATKTDGKPLPVKEMERFTMGATIGDNGLLVVSNSAIDPSVGMEGQNVQLEDESIVKITDAESEFLNVEISYGDRTVLKGKVISQDIGSDLAFILPDQEEAKTKKKTFDNIDLADFDTTAGPADQVIGLTRASSFHGFIPMVNMGRIQGVLSSQTERTFFLTSVSNDQGVPVFTLDGKPIGVTLMKIFEGKPTGVLTTLSAGSIKVMANLAMDKSSSE